jgi:hypothetical protein
MDLIDFRIHELNRDHLRVMNLWERQTDDRTIEWVLNDMRLTADSPYAD